MKENADSIKSTAESGTIDQSVSTSRLILNSSTLSHMGEDDITSILTPSKTALFFSKGDSKMEITSEEHYSRHTASKDKVHFFNSYFMRSFQIIAVGMILLMISCAGLGVWWGSTSAFAGILHTPIGGTIGLPFEIVCIFAAAAASFWTGVTGGPVVWDKASYVGKKLDIYRIEYITGKRYYLYEAELKVKLAKKIIHSIQIDIDRFYEISSELMRYLIYRNPEFNMNTGLVMVSTCIQTLKPPQKANLTKFQKTNITAAQINSYTIDLKIALAKYCIGKARNQFTENPYKDKNLDAKHLELYNLVGDKLKDEATNLAHIEAEVSKLLNKFSKLRIQFETSSEKYSLGDKWRANVSLTDNTTANIISKFFSVEPTPKDASHSLVKRKSNTSGSQQFFSQSNTVNSDGLTHTINSDHTSGDIEEALPLLPQQVKSEAKRLRALDMCGLM